MRIAIVHNALSSDSPADERDVRDQAQAVHAALSQSGHDPFLRECGLDLERIRRRLVLDKPDLVFNLVETLNGTGRMIHFFPGVLDALAIPYTGASAEALFLTSNKLTAKSWLRAAGLPTPDWARPGAELRIQTAAGQPQPAPDARPPDHPTNQWIVKSVWEHASVGLDEQAVVTWRGAAQMNALLQTRAQRLGGTCFAEAFIEGREFNLSLLEGPAGTQILPPAEIRFDGFGADRPRIVDYRAKWDADSFAYRHTPRAFDFDDEDRPLLARLRDLAAACWQAFDLKGYARVDFRVDSDGRPWILEVNANPCLAPDAGFAAAVAQAGLSYATAVEWIVAAAQSL
jgi:D-alanine-D-alanine ligase